MNGHQVLNDFYNEGFGWICRHCEREMNAGQASAAEGLFFHEGEADVRQPRAPFAKWADPARTTLTCPRCGVTEPAERA